MRIEQLEYLAAVTQHGSLRRASEQLHISQPALSEAVDQARAPSSASPSWTAAAPAPGSASAGSELQQFMVEVLEAVDRLRTAAGDQQAGHPVVRVGTVSTATSTLLVPAVREFRACTRRSTVEVLNPQQAEIDQGLREGTLDLGLVNVLAGDDPPADLASTDPGARPTGRRAAGGRTRSPAYDEVSVDQLRAEPFVAMRAGYLMHRFVHRLFGAHMPPVSYSTDGAELGKVMVAEGLGPPCCPTTASSATRWSGPG